MNLQIANVTFDCDDARRVAEFWSAALDRPLDADASEFFTSIGMHDDTVPALYFIKVPEPRSVKNRLHIDPVADDRENEIARLVELGATRGPDHDEYGHWWTVMADVKGNEFCIAEQATV